MKNLTIVWATVLFVGMAPIGLTQRGYAQPAQLTYSQTLAQIKHDFEGQHYKDAQMDAQKLLTLADSPEDRAAALSVLGETYYLQKMYEQARIEWGKILTTLPEDGNNATPQALARLGLARSYSAEGSFDKAIPYYKAVIAALNQVDEKDQDEKRNNEKVTNVLFLLALANAYYHTQQYELAQQQLELVIESSQDKDNSLYRLVASTRLSQIDFMQFRFKKSVAGFNQILAMKELPSGTKAIPNLKTYAQRQVEWGNSMIRNGWEGGVNKGLKLRVELENGSDELKIDAIIQTLNDALVDTAITESLEE